MHEQVKRCIARFGGAVLPEVIGPLRPFALAPRSGEREARGAPLVAAPRRMWTAILVVAVSLLCAARAAHAVSSAELFTIDSYRYGRYEARIQFPPADGVVGAFFLWKY